MGRNFVLNMADHGFAVAVYNRTTEKTRDFMETEVGARPIQAGYDLQEFIGLLRRPRALILLVAAGDPVDSGDTGNCCRCWRRRPHHRQRQLPFHRYQPPGQIPGREKSSLHGHGDLRGEAGARSGPSLMPGGSREMYARVAPILEAVAGPRPGRALRHLPGAALRRALRQDGPQRHRIRPHGTHRRDL